MITMRSCAEETQTHHRSQGCKLRRLRSRNSERPRESMEKVENEEYQVHLQWQSHNAFPKCHSLKRRSSSSEPSGPISYGFDRIKLHQVHVMSPVLLIHLSLRSSTQVLERIIELLSAWKQLLDRILVLLSDVVCVCVCEQRHTRLQDNAKLSRPGGCETM